MWCCGDSISVSGLEVWVRNNWHHLNTSKTERLWMLWRSGVNNFPSLKWHCTAPIRTCAQFVGPFNGSYSRNKWQPLEESFHNYNMYCTSIVSIPELGALLTVIHTFITCLMEYAAHGATLENLEASTGLKCSCAGSYEPPTIGACYISVWVALVASLFLDTIPSWWIL